MVCGMAAAHSEDESTTPVLHEPVTQIVKHETRPELSLAIFCQPISPGHADCHVMIDGKYPLGPYCNRPMVERSTRISDW